MTSFRNAKVPDRWVVFPQTKLNALFGFESNPNCQDWEHENADGFRVDEFLDAFTSHDLNNDEQFALMALCVSSADLALKRTC